MRNDSRCHATRNPAVLGFSIVATLLALPLRAEGHTGQILCERRYENFAWRPIRRGIYIDADGGVFRYDSTTGALGPLPSPEQGRPQQLPSDGQTIRTLSAGEIDEMQRLIELAAAGEMSPRRQQGADQGTLAAICYRIASSGDVTAVPISVEGLELPQHVVRGSGAQSVACWIWTGSRRSRSLHWPAEEAIDRSRPPQATCAREGIAMPSGRCS
ncbi:MAG: hypothetical protein R3E86_14550 [Pseudomonadales bacterium]